MSAISSRGRQIQSSALASAGASGVDTTAGTATSAENLSAMNIAADIEQARANAALKAWGFEAEELDLQRQQQLTAMTSKFQIAGIGLGAAGGFASAYAKRKP